MRGVTKPIEATGTISGPAQYFDGNDRIAIELSTVVDRTDFGINWNAPIPSGGNALANDVTITVELQLVRPTEA
jgi:polyisoprenoid-binding protein YceI